MSDQKPPRSGRPASWFFGAALIAIGALMVVLCGLCSMAFFVDFTDGASNRGSGATNNLIQTAVMVGIFGGVPIAIGVGLILVGWNLCRQR